MYLSLVDAHSKWMEMVLMQSIISAKMIEKLKIIFSAHGLPQKVVTDNGRSFTSQQFQQFMSENGILHIISAPYHPTSNGLAERAVRSFNQGLKRTPGDSIQTYSSHSNRSSPQKNCSWDDVYTPGWIYTTQICLRRYRKSSFNRHFSMIIHTLSVLSQLQIWFTPRTFHKHHHSGYLGE